MAIAVKGEALLPVILMWITIFSFVITRFIKSRSVWYQLRVSDMSFGEIREWITVKSSMFIEKTDVKIDPRDLLAVREVERTFLPAYYVMGIGFFVTFMAGIFSIVGS